MENFVSYFSNNGGSEASDPFSDDLNIDNFSSICSHVRYILDNI